MKVMNEKQRQKLVEMIVRKIAHEIWADEFGLIERLIALVPEQHLIESLDKEERVTILKKQIMGIKIQMGSADVVKQNSKQVEAEGWETIVDAVDTRDCLESLVRMLNEDAVPQTNCWFRIIAGATVIKL